MSKVIVQCNTFMKVDDFKKLQGEIKESYDSGVLVLPAYCELKAVIDSDEVEVLSRNGYQE